MMNEMLAGLNPEERLIMVLYYHEQLTFAEISRVLELSKSHVHQIHSEVLDRLRRRWQGEAGT